MTDLSVFADEEFNPKAYINNLCAQKPHDDQTIDRYAPPVEIGHIPHLLNPSVP